VTDALARSVAAVAEEAAAHAMARFGREIKRWEKSPGQLVCDVDLAVDAMLKERLGALIPDAGWLSEETQDDARRLDCARVWVVDPIDGTRDFLRGRPGWAVSVALVEAGQPVVGVLAAPARDERWLAVAGGGATRNGERLVASERALLAGARVPADALPKADRDFVAVAKPNAIALRMAMVAAGEADLLATARWGHEWDVAASVLIAREAGAVVTDALGAPLSFNKPDARAFGLLATAPAMHAAALERLRPRAEATLARV
jgi:myo-inositol-1(or 4)-monophosphatase